MFVSKFLQEYLHLFSLGNKWCNSIKKFHILTYCKYNFKLASPCHDFQQHFLKSKLFWHNPLLGNPLKGNLQVKNVGFWNATPVGVHFFQGSYPSVKLLFKRHLVHKVEFAIFNTMDKIYYWGKDVSRRSTNSSDFSAMKLSLWRSD